MRVEIRNHNHDRAVRAGDALADHRGLHRGLRLGVRHRRQRRGQLVRHLRRLQGAHREAGLRPGDAIRDRRLRPHRLQSVGHLAQGPAGSVHVRE